MRLKHLRDERAVVVDGQAYSLDILYGSTRKGDFAIFKVNTPQNRYFVAEGTDPYIEDVRLAINPNGKEPVSITPIVMGEVEAPDKAVRGILNGDNVIFDLFVQRIDGKTLELRPKSLRYGEQEKEFAAACENLFS